MHVVFEREELGRSQSHTGGGDALDGRVVGQVDEEDRPLNRAGAPEVGDEVVGFLEGNPHGGEDHREAGACAQHLRLAGDLGGQAGMGQAGAGEDGQFLAAHHGVHAIDRRDPGLDELGRVVARVRVDRKAVDIQPFLGDDPRPLVPGLPQTAEDTPEHIQGNGQFNPLAQEAHPGGGDVDPGGALEDLHQGFVTVHLQNLAAPDLSSGHLDFSQLAVFNPLHLLHQHQGAGHFRYSAVFFKHLLPPPRRIARRPVPESPAPLRPGRPASLRGHTWSGRSAPAPVR